MIYELRAASCERDSLISVVCQCSMRTAFTVNMAEEVFNVVIVNRRFVLLFFKLSVQAPFRQRYRFKSTCLTPVSEKNQTLPSLKAVSLFWRSEFCWRERARRHLARELLALRGDKSVCGLQLGLFLDEMKSTCS